MIPCAIFAIGTELLEGSVTDTNSAYIAKNLTSEGLSPQFISLLSDDKNTISTSIESAMRSYPLVITTGGLGPTFDDLTPEAVAQACGKKTVLFKAAEKHLTEWLSHLKVDVRKNHLQQAFLPEGSILFHNPCGTAYGFGAEAHGSIVISMPGVPYEMSAMFKKSVLPFLKNRFMPNTPFKIDLCFGNVPESAVDNVIRELNIPCGVTCIINASLGEVVVKIRDNGLSGGEQLAENIKTALNYCYLGENNENPALTTLELLKKSGLTLSVVESCTGGLLSGALTSIPGVSDIFMGSVVAYDNKVKIEQLGVYEEILHKDGAVSEKCAIAMANGIRTLLHTDSSISVTGVAGPSGGTPDKPVGTVYIAVAVSETLECQRFLLRGDRSAVQKGSIKNALTMLIKLLRDRQL